MMLCRQLQHTPEAYNKDRFPLDGKGRPLWNSTRNDGKNFQIPFEYGECVSVDVFKNKKDKKDRFALACTQCSKNFKGEHGSEEYHNKVFKLVISKNNLMMVNETVDGSNHATDEHLYCARNFFYHPRWIGDNKIPVGKCKSNDDTSGVGNNVWGYYAHWLSAHYNDEAEVPPIVQRAMEILQSSKEKAFTDKQPLSRKKKRGDSLTAPIPGEAKLGAEEVL